MLRATEEPAGPVFFFFCCLLLPLMPSCLVFSHFLSVCSFLQGAQASKIIGWFGKKTSLEFGYNRLLSTNSFIFFATDGLISFWQVIRPAFIGHFALLFPFIVSAHSAAEGWFHSISQWIYNKQWEANCELSIWTHFHCFVFELTCSNVGIIIKIRCG